MAKEKAQTPQQEPVLPEQAFGVSQNKDGVWCTVTVSYNSLTGEAKVTEALEQPAKAAAVEAFKIAVGKSDILN